MIGVIGMVRGDIVGRPYGQVVREEYNPGTLSMEFAGAGMNICRNLRAVGAVVNLFSVAGDDLPGRAALIELDRIGVDTKDFLLLEGRDTAMSLEIRNIVEELEMAFGNKDVGEKMDAEFFEHRLETLREADLLVCDASCSPAGWRVLLEERKDVPLVVDPDSVEPNRIKEGDLALIDTLVPNRREAEIISGLQILSEEELMTAGEWFIDRGVKRIFITLAGGGVYCREGVEAHILRPEEGVVASTKGAGDAFASGIALAQAKGKNLRETAKYAMAMAQMTLQVDGYVNDKLSREELKGRLK